MILDDRTAIVTDIIPELEFAVDTCPKWKIRVFAY